MSKLEKALIEWTSLGLINQTQAEKISQHEASKSSWGLSSILTLGVTAISIGIISLIAANWQEIPDIAKLILDFALLTTLAMGMVKFWQSKNVLLFEGLLIGFLLLCLASIGLIAQIYHTGGELYQALLLWAFITCGIIFFAKRLFAPFIWVGGFLIAITFTLANSPLFWPLFQDHYDPIVMFMPLLFVCITFVLQQKLSSENSLVRAFKSWTLITLLSAIAFIELNFNASLQSQNTLMSYLSGYCLILFTGICIYWMTPYNRLQKYLLTLALFIFVLQSGVLWQFTFLTFHTYKFFYAVTTILIFGLLAIFFASLKKRRLFQLFIILIGLRLLILYFQALGGLAMTGLGLVTAGILIIAMGVLWSKYRTKLMIRIERWLQ